jgi:hypothetical protein
VRRTGSPLPAPHWATRAAVPNGRTRPIGFHATLSFLEQQAGQSQRDEIALLRALDLIECFYQLVWALAHFW